MINQENVQNFNIVTVTRSYSRILPIHLSS